MATNPPPPAPQSSGVGEFLKTQIGPFPLWIWLIAGAGVAAFFVIPRLMNRSSANSPAASDQTSTDAGTAAINTLSSAGIDPYTGIPYSVESSTNPATGLPNYYNGASFPAGTIGGPALPGPVTNQTQPPGSSGPPPPPPPSGQQNPSGPGGLNTKTGFQFTPSSPETVIQIAQQEYGFQPGDPRLNNAVYDILSHNQSTYPGALYNTPITPGKSIFIPPVNPQTGWGTTPKQ